MIELLIIAICILATFQPTRERFLIAWLYALACSTHNYFLGDISGVFYYLSAGAFDFIVLAIICIYAKPKWFSNQIIGISTISLILNFYGWIIYELYLPPTSYNIAFNTLYLYAILILLWKDSAHDFGTNKRWAFLRLSHFKFNNACHPLHKKAEF